MTRIFILIILASLTRLAAAESNDPTLTREDGDTGCLRLGALFQDHMVLQRDMPVKIWGWCAAGEMVTVSFGCQTETAVADMDGRWMVILKPMQPTS
ncbi:MAG: hypothetical protein ACO3JG_16210, partial [Luteolibacter sp.]